MAKKDEPVTVAEVLEMQPGTKGDPTWIHGTLGVTLRSPKSINETMQACVLEDPDTDASIACTFIGRKAALPADGSLVELCGSMVRTEYKGRPQVTAFAKCQFNVVRAALASTPKAQAAAASSSSGKPDYDTNQRLAREGQRIGNCLSNAALDARVVLKPEELASHEALKEFVWKRASIYLAVADALERGVVAGRKQEAAPAAQAPAPQRQQTPPVRAASRPQPGPDGSAFRAGEDVDDVPFAPAQGW